MKTLSPAVITLPWRQDAAEFYFSRLSHLPWAMLLHSGYADHPYSRFDIVVADPICTLTTFGKETVVSESEKRTTTTDDPLQVLQQVLDRADIRPTHNEDLPFQGGALGLFGYDLGRRFESLPEIAEQDIVLPDMAVGIYDWALIVDHQRHTVSLLSHNDVNARRAWLESQQFSPQEDFTLTSDWQSNMTREQYGEKFRQVQEYLHKELGEAFVETKSGRVYCPFVGSIAVKRKIEKFTLPYTLLSTKYGFSSKLLSFPCSNTNKPPSLSKLFWKISSGIVSSSFKA